MARKKSAPIPPQRDEFIKVRTTPQFKAWLEAFAESNQLTMTDTIIQALIDRAKTRGFEPPPKR